MVRGRGDDEGETFDQLRSVICVLEVRPARERFEREFRQVPHRNGFPLESTGGLYRW